jgi:hypothetical protein
MQLVMSGIFLKVLKLPHPDPLGIQCHFYLGKKKTFRSIPLSLAARLKGIVSASGSEDPLFESRLGVRGLCTL